MKSIDRHRLAKVLGRLGSAHDGEVASAGRMADSLVRDAGTTWLRVLAPQHAVAEDAARVLLAENEQLQHQVSVYAGQIETLHAVHEELRDRARQLAAENEWLLASRGTFAHRIIDGARQLAISLIALAVAFGSFGLIAGLLLYIANQFLQ